jgi:hypothetical protein
MLFHPQDFQREKCGAHPTFNKMSPNSGESSDQLHVLRNHRQLKMEPIDWMIKVQTLPRSETIITFIARTENLIRIMLVKRLSFRTWDRET